MSRPPDTHPRDLLSPYLDGEMADAVKLDVERHLAACVECRTFLEDLRALGAAAVGELPPPVPPDLRRRIRLALDNEPAPRRVLSGRWFVTHRLGLAAAGAVLILGVLTLRLDLTSSGPEPVTRRDAPGVPADADQAASAPRAPREADEQTRPEATRGPAKSPSAPRVDALRRSTPVQVPSPAVPRIEAEAQPSGKPLAETVGVAPSSAMQRRALGASGMKDVAAAPPVRSLQFEFPEYKVSVTEDGRVGLSAEGYSCESRLAGESVDPDVTALFAFADSRAARSTYAPSPAPAGLTGSVWRMIPPPERTDEAKGSPRGSEGSVDEEMKARLQSLLHGRYLTLMEERCGPAPRAVRTR